jgi:predicted dehydrogenase
MTGQRFKVGIVGLQPDSSWAARAHVPALRALSESFEIVGVANTSLTSAEKAAAATGLPRAFADVAELIAAPEIDIVTVTVKVPHHLEIVKAAIGAGKHVYCEWPLGNGPGRGRGTRRACSGQGSLGGGRNPGAGRSANGFVGEVLSTTLVAWGGGWGGSIHGTEGDIRVWLPPAAIRSWCRSHLRAHRTGRRRFGRWRSRPHTQAGPEGLVPGNMARLYDRMARTRGTAPIPLQASKDAVVLHRAIAPIEKAAESGSRTVLS